MNLSKFIILGLLVTLTGCLNKVSVFVRRPMEVTLGPGGPATPSGSATLTSAAFTIKTTATVSLSCSSGATHYKESATAPSLNDGGWVACPTGVATITPALSAGDNTLKYWFKNAVEVTSTSLDLSIKQGPIRILSPDFANTSYFGSENVIELTPDRILVTDPQNSTVANRAGAVHIYDHMGNLIRSIYGSTPSINFGGDKTNCEWTCFGTTGKLLNGKFYVATSEFDSAGGTINDGGIIQFFNSDGDKLFDLEGDDLLDFMGDSNVIELPNGNIVVQTWGDNEGALNDVGSVILLNGTNGNVITKLTGDDADDRLGDHRFFNYGNYIIIASASDDVGGLMNAGSVKIINGASGAIIANIEGDTAGAFLGSQEVTALSNGKLLILSQADDNGGLADAGSATLVDIATGTIITKIYGDQASDALANGDLLKLSNGNFLITSYYDNTATLTGAGSVKLVDGTTGAVIATVEGDNNNDQLGSSGVVELSNGNFLIKSPHDDNDTGSIKIVNGTNGTVIATLNGDNANDNFGDRAYDLENGNFIVSSPMDNTTVAGGGSVKLYSYAGAALGSIGGTKVSEALGYFTKALSNGNYVVTSADADVGAISSAGAVYLINGTNGAIITTISGDNSNDQIGGDGITVLENGNFIISSPYDDVGGNSDAGSVMLVNGSTGAILNTQTGDEVNDLYGKDWIEVLSDNYFMIASYSESVAGLSEAGSGTLINGSDGTVLAKISGDNLDDRMSYYSTLRLSSGHVIMRSAQDTVGANAYTGSLYIIPTE